MFWIRGRIALLSDGFTALVWSVALPQDQQGNHFVYVSQKDPQDVSLHSFEANKQLVNLTICGIFICWALKRQ